MEAGMDCVPDKGKYKVQCALCVEGATLSCSGPALVNELRMPRMLVLGLQHAGLKQWGSL